MKLWIMGIAIAIPLAAACGDQTPEPRVSDAYSGGAAGGASAPPAGEREPLPPSPRTSGAEETKPDPGDANDHSSPRHDAKDKSSGG
jgi:hypothetical protein